MTGDQTGEQTGDQSSDDGADGTPRPEELVHYGVADRVATLTLDSPHNRNALSSRLVQELQDGLARAEGDDDVRVVVIRATGRTFCSGADLSEATSGGMEQTARGMVGLQRRIVEHPKPVVVLGGRQAVVQLGDQLARERVAVVLAVEHQRGDVVVHAVVHQLGRRRLHPPSLRHRIAEGDLWVTFRLRCRRSGGDLQVTFRLRCRRLGGCQ